MIETHRYEPEKVTMMNNLEIDPAAIKTTYMLADERDIQRQHSQFNVELRDFEAETGADLAEIARYEEARMVKKAAVEKAASVIVPIEAMRLDASQSVDVLEATFASIDESLRDLHKELNYIHTHIDDERQLFSNKDDELYIHQSQLDRLKRGPKSPETEHEIIGLQIIIAEIDAELKKARADKFYMLGRTKEIPREIEDKEIVVEAKQLEQHKHRHLLTNLQVALKDLKKHYAEAVNDYTTFSYARYLEELAARQPVAHSRRAPEAVKPTELIATAQGHQLVAGAIGRNAIAVVGTTHSKSVAHLAYAQATE